MDTAHRTISIPASWSPADLKSARMQRITVVMGDDGRASLIPYYEAQAVLS
ncbi:hypothetical protein Shyhy01_07210 [Streptomyces hygroscopicus subsp. hygroscopicus]|nr:hypothetical protein Shyhy01_07210 [Streptomyces hygroscopicus subsp. hygroscopicus]